MTIEEMHINVDMDLQKVSTYTQRNLQPQELDYFFNREVIKFIKQRTNPKSNVKQIGTDKTIKRYEDLDDLTKSVELDVRVDSDGEYGTCILPDDYYAYITSKTNVYQLCDNEVVNGTAKTYYKCVFPLSFPLSTVLTTYTITLNRTSGNSVIFNMANLPTGYIQNVDINKQRFMLLKAINILAKENLDTVVSNAFHFYWERYDENFYNNSFILVSELPFTSITVTVNSTPIVYSSQSLTYNIYDKISPLWANNRLIEDEFQFQTGLSKLSKSHANFVSIQLKQMVLKVEFPKTVISKKIKLVYVSKPSILDLVMKRNLNMKDTVVQEIVSNTVRFLKGVFKGDYETYLNENIMIE